MQDKHIIQKLINDNQSSVIAEIGVMKGNTALFLLEHCPSIETYYAVDAWVWTPEYAGSKEFADSTRKMDDSDWERWYQDLRAVEDDRLILVRDWSIKAAKHFEDKSLDLVFLDAQHTYLEFKQDLEAWTSKVRDGGILCGHDYFVNDVYYLVNKVFKQHYVQGRTIWWVRR